MIYNFIQIFSDAVNIQQNTGKIICMLWD